MLRNSTGEIWIAGATSLAVTPASWRRIDGGANSGHGVVATAAGTAAKTVNIPRFSLGTGSSVTLSFTNGNTNTDATLNVTSTGARGLRFNGGAIAAGMIPVGHIADLVFDGTFWQLLNPRPYVVDSTLVF